MAEGDLLGRTELTVAEIMGARSWTVTKKLTAQVLNKEYGSVTIMGLKLEVRNERPFIVFTNSNLNMLRVSARIE